MSVEVKQFCVEGSQIDGLLVIDTDGSYQVFCPKNLEGDNCGNHPCSDVYPTQEQFASHAARWHANPPLSHNFCPCGTYAGVEAGTWRDFYLSSDEMPECAKFDKDGKQQEELYLLKDGRNLSVSAMFGIMTISGLETQSFLRSDGWTIRLRASGVVGFEDPDYARRVASY